MPTASVNGIDINYERAGDGPRLLFLNGSGATLASTAMLMAPFRDGFDLVAFDQRGLGLTSIPDGPYSMADYAADALGLMDHVGWDTCAVVGISFGGMVALELAVTAPQRVDRLALLCTSAGGDGGSSYPLHDLATMAPDQRARVGTEILDTRFTPEWLDAHRRDRVLADFMAARSAQPRSDDARRGQALQLEARRHHDTWDRLDRITCPTFVAAGRYDGIAPLSNSEAIASRIDKAELHVYDGGHAFFVQDKQAFPEVVDFLASA